MLDNHIRTLKQLFLTRNEKVGLSIESIKEPDGNIILQLKNTIPEIKYSMDRFKEE